MDSHLQQDQQRSFFTRANRPSNLNIVDNSEMYAKTPLMHMSQPNSATLIPDQQNASIASPLVQNAYAMNHSRIGNSLAAPSTPYASATINDSSSPRFQNQIASAHLSAQSPSYLTTNSHSSNNNNNSQVQQHMGYSTTYTNVGKQQQQQQLTNQQAPNQYQTVSSYEPSCYTPTYTPCASSAHLINDNKQNYFNFDFNNNNNNNNNNNATNTLNSTSNSSLMTSSSNAVDNHLLNSAGNVMYNQSQYGGMMNSSNKNNLQTVQSTSLLNRFQNLPIPPGPSIAPFAGGMKTHINQSPHLNDTVSGHSLSVPNSPIQQTHVHSVHSAQPRNVNHSAFEFNSPAVSNSFNANTLNSSGNNNNNNNNNSADVVTNNIAGSNNSTNFDLYSYSNINQANSLNISSNAIDDIHSSSFEFNSSVEPPNVAESSVLGNIENQAPGVQGISTESKIGNPEDTSSLVTTNTYGENDVEMVQELINDIIQKDEINKDTSSDEPNDSYLAHTIIDETIPNSSSIANIASVELNHQTSDAAIGEQQKTNSSRHNSFDFHLGEPVKEIANYCETSGINQGSSFVLDNNSNNNSREHKEIIHKQNFEDISSIKMCSGIQTTEIEKPKLDLEADKIVDNIDLIRENSGDDFLLYYDKYSKVDELTSSMSDISYKMKSNAPTNIMSESEINISSLDFGDKNYLKGHGSKVKPKADLAHKDADHTSSEKVFKARSSFEVEMDESNAQLSLSNLDDGVGSSSASSGAIQNCPECNKIFTNKSALAKHRLIHSNERKYGCHLCDKSFKRQDHLNGHLLTHQEKKPFECKAPNCEKSYCDSRSLKRHVESQHQDFLALLANGNQEALHYLPSIGKIKANVAPNVQHEIIVQNTSKTMLHIDNALNKVEDSLSPLPFKMSENNEAFQTEKAANTRNKNFFTFEEPKPETCKICGKGFKNIPALNGHMRLHGGFIKTKFSNSIKCDDGALVDPNNSNAFYNQQNEENSRSSSDSVYSYDSSNQSYGKLNNSNLSNLSNELKNSNNVNIFSNNELATDEKKSKDNIFNENRDNTNSEAFAKIRCNKQKIVSAVKDSQIKDGGCKRTTNETRENETVKHSKIEVKSDDIVHLNCSSTNILPNLNDDSTITGENNKCKFPTYVNANANNSYSFEHSFPKKQNNVFLPKNDDKLNSYKQTQINQFPDTKQYHANSNICDLNLANNNNNNSDKFENTSSVFSLKQFVPAHNQTKGSCASSKNEECYNNYSKVNSNQASCSNQQSQVHEFNRQKNSEKTLHALSSEPSTSSQSNKQAEAKKCQLTKVSNPQKANNSSEFSSNPDNRSIDGKSEPAYYNNNSQKLPPPSFSKHIHDAITNVAFLNHQKQMYTQQLSDTNNCMNHNFLPKQDPLRTNDYFQNACNLSVTLNNNYSETTMHKENAANSKIKSKPLPLCIPSDISAFQNKSPQQQQQHCLNQLTIPSGISNFYPQATLLKSPRLAPLNCEMSRQYTPPPMLSPFRKGPGLYYKLFSSLLMPSLMNSNTANPFAAAENMSNNINSADVNLQAKTYQAAQLSFLNNLISSSYLYPFVQSNNQLEPPSSLVTIAAPVESNETRESEKVFKEPVMPCTITVNAEKTHTDQPNENKEKSQLNNTDQEKTDQNSIKPIFTRPKLMSQTSSSSFFPNESDEKVSTPFDYHDSENKPFINVGKDYQAKIPSLIENKSENLELEYKEDLLWMPDILSKISLNQFKSYLELISSSLIHGSSNNLELGLHILYYFNGDSKKSIKSLLDGYIDFFNNHPIKDYIYPETSLWTQKEIQSFESSIIKNDKLFSEIAREVETKSIKQCIEFYYTWKKVMSDGTKKKWRVLKKNRVIEDMK